MDASYIPLAEARGYKTHWIKNIFFFNSLTSCLIRLRGYYITKIGKFVLVIFEIFRLLCVVKDAFHR